MFEVIFSMLVGIAILACLEWAHKQGRISTEVSRKTIHVTTGLILATWPFFVTWEIILAVELVYLFVAALVRHYMPLQSQHNIGRKSWGEFFFSFGVIGTILLGAPRWIFVLAILHLALADAVAALVGVKYGKSNTYKVFGHKKSLAGSAAFFVVSATLVGLTFWLAPNHVTANNMLPLLLLPFVTTISENVGVYGTDNFLIPLTVIITLSV